MVQPTAVFGPVEFCNAISRIVDSVLNYYNRNKIRVGIVNQIKENIIFYT